MVKPQSQVPPHGVGGAAKCHLVGPLPPHSSQVYRKLFESACICDFRFSQQPGLPRAFSKDVYDQKCDTTDEGGGYYDSGYVQPLDFFGDGTRIPLIVVSPHTIPGHVSHDYADHVSLIKFIEHNGNLGMITKRSRDNYPNPTYDKTVSKYAPTNSPDLSDLFDLFDFGNGEK